ncbi:unnamed protein product, partial [marine sediment metagenome]
MTVATHQLKFKTRGDAEIRDLTSEVAEAVADSGLKNGIVTVFCPGSTGAVTTIEFESGALADLKRL